MIDILVPDTIARYDISQPPGPANAGGGMSVKYARVEEALSMRYTVRRLSDVEDVNADIVIVDPLWFTWGGDIDEKTEAFLCCGFERVLICGSESNLLYWPHRLRARVVIQDATWRTHNSRYQRQFLRTCGIYDSQYLCDPVPESLFYPATKAPRIYASGQISWEKRTESLVELYTYLQGSHVETCYVGSATTWGDDDNPESLSERFRLQALLQDVTDTFHGNVTQAQVARISNTSQFFMHVAEHDTSCQGEQEAAMGGACLFGLGHPINAERPVRQFVDIAECAEAILQTRITSRANTKVHDFAMRNWSYEAFLKQFDRLQSGG